MNRPPAPQPGTPELRGLPELVDMAVYDDAEFYDAEFAERSHDVDFFLDQALKAGGPVLEVACGTGRITLPIGRAGVEITGLDVMASMLDRARAKSAAEGLPVTWIEGDCRTLGSGLPPEQRYALIFSATNAMQHLHDLDSVIAFLTSAREVLAPGGVLLLDVFNPQVAKLARTRAQRYLQKTIHDPSGRQLAVEAASEYDAATQLLHFTLDYRLPRTRIRQVEAGLVGLGEVLRTKKVSMRCFFPEELLALCRLAGLEVVDRWGSYAGEPFSGSAGKQILFCRAAGDDRR